MRTFLLALFLLLPSFALTQERTPYKIDETYTGPNEDVFNQLRWDIPNMIRQITIDMAVRLGLQFNEGWRYPLTIRFTDTTPRGAENALAFVTLYSDGKSIAQDLSINLRAYKEQKFNFEKVFAHELVHAMLNDAVGAQSMTIFPIWVNEGLAVFGADQGEQMVKDYVYRHSGFAESQLLNGLERHVSALDYAEDYWGMKYINEVHGPNSLHFFVRELVERKGNVKEAYEYATNESWDDFIKNAHEFAKEEIQKIGPAQRGYNGRPY